VFCNCDDPRVSNFFHYFSNNFEFLGLKKLITTCYKNQNANLFSQNKIEKAIYLEYTGDKNENRVPDPSETDIKHLKGNGDFRSKESIELLKQADIVVTNPPFSLFREYVAQLVEYKKKFIMIGNKNAITYKETFRLIKDNKLWLGNTSPKEFLQPSGETKKSLNGLTRWFTNLSHNKRNEELILYKKYNKTEYPKYDNYDAINVDKVKEIPVNYKGVMGVPITFLDKHNPKQFEIIGIAKRGAGDPALKSKVYTIKDSKKYSDLNAGPVLKKENGLKSIYPRILIKIK